jgi:hypothetical protein
VYPAVYFLWRRRGLVEGPATERARAVQAVANVAESVR